MNFGGAFDVWLPLVVAVIAFAVCIFLCIFVDVLRRILIARESRIRSRIKKNSTAARYVIGANDGFRAALKQSNRTFSFYLPSKAKYDSFCPHDSLVEIAGNCEEELLNLIENAHENVESWMLYVSLMVDIPPLGEKRAKRRAIEEAFVDELMIVEPPTSLDASVTIEWSYCTPMRESRYANFASYGEEDIIEAIEQSKAIEQRAPAQ